MSSWALLGCSGVASFASDGEVYSDCASLIEPPAEQRVLTWWDIEGKTCVADVGGDVCAAEALRNGYRNCSDLSHGGIIFTDPGDRDALVHELMIERKFDSDAVIFNGGSDVYKLANCADESDVRPGILSLGSSDQTITPSIRLRIPDELLPLVSCPPPDNRIFATVLGLHRLNVLFYDSQVLEERDIVADLAALPQDQRATERFLRELQVVTDHEHPKPLVIQNETGSWSRFLLENVMVALGKEANLLDGNGYKTFWEGLSIGAAQGYKVVNMSLIDEALAYAAQIAPYIRYETKSPVALIGRSVIGDVLPPPVYAVTGDWESSGGAPLVDTRPFPSTEEVFVYTADVLALVNKDDSPLDVMDSRIGLLHSATSAGVQHVYAEYKDSDTGVRLSAEQTSAKSADELFAENGKALTGIRGLPSYVPDETFVDLATHVQGYMLCLVDASAEIEGWEELQKHCDSPKQLLYDYIKDQYCTVLTGNADGCEIVNRRQVHRTP